MLETPVCGIVKTIKQRHERASVLYEPSSGNGKISSRHKGNPHGRDISEYQTNEPAPTEEDVKNFFSYLLVLTAQKSGALATLRKYLGKRACWLKCGLSKMREFEHYVQTLLPSIFIWTLGKEVLT